MSWWYGIRSRVRSLLRRGRVEAELDEEIAFHIDQQSEAYVRAGMGRAEARERALRDFGRVDAVKEDVRYERGTRVLEDTVRDLGYAVRRLRRNPGFTAAALITLALGIGANAAIFSVVNAVLWRPLPYPEADRLVLLWNRSTASGSERQPVPAPDVAVYRDLAAGFEGFTFVDRLSDLNLTNGDRPLHVRAARVDPTFFRLLGVPAALGRDFSLEQDVLPPEVADDTTAELPPTPVMVSHGLWQEHFGGDVEVVGRGIRIGGQVSVVVGVAPRGFELLLPPDAGIGTRADVWFPIRVDLSRVRRAERLIDQDSDNSGAVFARLRPGVTLGQARAEMDRIAERLRREVPGYRNAGLRIDVEPLKASAVQHARRILLALWTAVGLVLLIACLNVSNLLLARALGRRGEMSLRRALGASRWRLVRQLLAESAVLAVVGGGLGLLVAFAALPLIVQAGPTSMPRLAEAGIDGAALAFALACSLLAALLFGLAPALSATDRRRGGSDLVRQRDGQKADRRGLRLRNGLVVSQVTISLVLLVAAGLLWRTVASLSDVKPGFEPQGVLTFELSLRDADRYAGPADRARFVHQLARRLESLPGVEAVGLVGRLPLSGELWTQPYGREGESVAEWSAKEADFRMVTSGYFRAMGTRLLAGRYFSETEDLYERERVTIIDEKMARRLDPGGNAVGMRLGFPLDGAPVSARVVGIVEHVRHQSLATDGRETIYVPYRQEASREFAVVLRSSVSPSSLVAPARVQLRAIAAGIPMYNVRTMEDYVGEAMAPSRFALGLIGLFAVLATLLAALGIYGIMSYVVRQRAREFGIRMALGAQRSTLILQVVASGLVLTGIGVALGLALAVPGSRLIAGLLYGVSRIDPVTYTAVPALIGLISALACWVPARRAARIDPAQALRHDG